VIVGATTSPERLVRALDSEAYVPALARFAGERTSAQEIALSLLADDARAACDVLRGVHEATGHRDGWVSVPLDPRLARDTGSTLLAAKSVHALVDRPNLLVAIPATHHGLPALRDAVTAGISVTATYVYSLDRFRAVQAAYVEGLERAEYAGIDLRTVGSFVSLPLSPVDSAFDALLDKLRDRGGTKLRDRVAIANAVLAYQAFEARLTLPRWRDLAASGALPQRPVWTSTTAEDHDGSAGRYVTELVAPGAVAAVTEETLAAVESGSDVRGDTIHAVYAEAQGVLDDVERLGISYPEVATALEEATLAEAVQAWEDFLDRLSPARRA
jgi:transaldolase